MILLHHRVQDSPTVNATSGTMFILIANSKAYVQGILQQTANNLYVYDEENYGNCLLL